MMNNTLCNTPLSPAAMAGKGGFDIRRAVRLIAALAFVLCAACLAAGCVPKTENDDEKGAEGMQGNVVFFGDSITFMGKWQSWFPDNSVTNLGVSGDRVEDLIDRIDELYEARPKGLFIMIGVNDLLSGFTVEETLEDFTSLLDMLPGCRVIVASVLPVDARFGDRAELIPRYNERLKALCEERGLEYVDLFPLFDDGTGHINALYTRDGLHLSSEGYAVWVEKIRPMIEGKRN